MNKAVFLDRDGILTKEKSSPKNKECLKINYGIEKALAHIKNMGYLVFCITNQPDISRGLITKLEVEEINDILWTVFPQIAKFMYCGHDNADNCICRKPQPGMIISLAREYEVDLSKSWVVGDRWRDIEAGKSAGCRTIFYNYRNQGEISNSIPDFTVKSPEGLIKIFKGV